MQLSTYIIMASGLRKKKPEMNDELLPVISKRDKQQRNGSDVGKVYSIAAVIRHEGDQWCVRSEKGKNLGCGPSKHWAHVRLGQVEILKKQKS